MVDTDPLILTAAFDPVAAGLFQRLRDQHFPARLNIVPAHCTLFHALPGPDRTAIAERLRQTCADETPMRFATAGLRFLGRGVAIALAAERLVALHAALAQVWRPVLSAQDRQGFRPHVTVQNKVAPGVARTLHAHLMASLPLTTGSIEGLDLWVYRNGPWDHCERFPFTRGSD